MAALKDIRGPLHKLIKRFRQKTGGGPTPGGVKEQKFVISVPNKGSLLQRSAAM